MNHKIIVAIVLLFLFNCTYDFDNKSDLDKFIEENNFNFIPVIHNNFITSCYYPTQKICLTIETYKNQIYTTSQKQNLCTQMDGILAQFGENSEQKDLYCFQFIMDNINSGCAISFDVDLIAKFYKLYFYSNSNPQKTLQQYCENIRYTIANQYNLPVDLFYIFYF